MIRQPTGRLRSDQEVHMSEMTLPKTYDFSAIEPEIYAMWESHGYFKPALSATGKPFVISMPPPNVTGELHLGHAMFVAMEDLMIRHSRMKGAPTLWVPGTDHAGIATQLQVERHLLATEEVTREEIGREAFEARVWEWKRKYGPIIGQQIRRLGASCDWARERFTLDEGLSHAVREAFVTLYEKGLIYRGTYLINWSPGLKTAVSDLEVEYTEEQGTLYTFKSPLAESGDFIPVATTRPETILGDTAVAVHPEDARYASLVGQTCLVPILNRAIPVIADDGVDMTFGTGALKVTPGHDAHDYEIAQRHDLEIISLLNPDATMNEQAGPYAGLDRYECREKLWRDMGKAGLTIKTEPYTMQVPRSQRGGEVIEPMISTQWFVKMAPLAEPALEAVRSGKIRIVPDRFTKVYFNWLENIRDWCISRQLWWGHRIPAWHCAACGQITVTRQDPDRCAHCGSTDLHQDADVLDTWFSSGLWPFSTLGWPEDTQDLRTFYPTSLMETGYDILFFWVARMIMMGLEFTGQVPFETVYLHGLIRDERGRKMSKTLGNFIDPLVVMDEFGTDALRFYLLTSSTPGSDINVSAERIEASRNFANKLWNAGRLVVMAIERAPAKPAALPEPTQADRWITGRLGKLQREVDRLFERYQYGEAGRQVVEFFWSEFADWYLEISKLQLDHGGGRAWLTAKTMVDILDTCLRLLHPFTPYVTESLWGHLKQACAEVGPELGPAAGWEEALIVARWPEPPPESAVDQQADTTFTWLMDLVRAVRNVRSERGVEPARQIAAIVHAGMWSVWFESQREVLSALARIDPDRLQIAAELSSTPDQAVPLVVGPIEAYLPVADLFDVTLERQRLQADLAEVQGQIERLETLLAGPFAERAPAAVVEKERSRLADYRVTHAKLQHQLTALTRG
jgi:valyl-tRNA synthetase